MNVGNILVGIGAATVVALVTAAFIYDVGLELRRAHSRSRITTRKQRRDEFVTRRNKRVNTHITYRRK